jgi:putative transposase
MGQSGPHTPCAVEAVLSAVGETSGLSGCRTAWTGHFILVVIKLPMVIHLSPMEFRFFDPSVSVSVTRGHLPHWDQAGATYFITWRTADSIPKDVWEHWRWLRSCWLREKGINPEDTDWRKQVEALPEERYRDFRRFSRALEHELDSCHGDCPFRLPECTAIVAESLHHFDGDRYLLGDYVIMPNHVHVLVGGIPRGRMLRQVELWKHWTAIQVNRHLGRRGRFWQDESFDHLVRSETAFQRLRRYIAGNPGKLNPGEFLHWVRP